MKQWILGVAMLASTSVFGQEDITIEALAHMQKSQANVYHIGLLPSHVDNYMQFLGTDLQSFADQFLNPEYSRFVPGGILEAHVLRGEAVYMQPSDAIMYGEWVNGLKNFRKDTFAVALDIYIHPESKMLRTNFYFTKEKLCNYSLSLKVNDKLETIIVTDDNEMHGSRYLLDNEITFRESMEQFFETLQTYTGGPHGKE